MELVTPKHAKPIEVITAEADGIEYYKERNHTLLKENQALRNMVDMLEKKIDSLNKDIDTFRDKRSYEIEEYQNLLEEKGGEIAALKMQINMLKEAVVKGALREVL